MELSKIVDVSLNKFDSEWDLYDLPDRETCVRNLEALLCKRSRAGEDTAQILEVLAYFRSVQSLRDVKLENADKNIEPLSLTKNYLVKFKRKLADATRDTLAVIGAMVVISALSGTFVSECASHSQPGGNNNVVLPQPIVGSHRN